MVVGESHPLAKKRRLAFKDTLSFAHIVMRHDFAMQAQFESVAKNSKRSLLVSGQVSGFSGMRHLASAGLGVGCMPLESIQPFETLLRN